MRKAVRRHPIVSAMLTLAVIFAVFTFYVFRSTSKDSAGVSLSLGNKVAIIEINGVILDSRDIVDEMEDVRKNGSVKAVVVRINSPGGGVAPSQEIYSEIIRLRQSKKVVASLSSVAASGGYYVASAAEKIVANPGTLTGSIGVIMDFSNVEGLFEKIGLKGYAIKSGKYKDIGSPVREMTADERTLLQDVIDNVHSQFVSAVAKGRGMEAGNVADIADGRILSGEQALGLGLVDNLGGLQEAVKMAAEMAGIEGEPKVYYEEKKKGLIEYILGSQAVNFIKQISVPQLMYRMACP